MNNVNARTPAEVAFHREHGYFAEEFSTVKTLHNLGGDQQSADAAGELELGRFDIYAYRYMVVECKAAQVSGQITLKSKRGWNIRRVYAVHGDDRWNGTSEEEMWRIVFYRPKSESADEG
jgi:hypothetical protein